MGYRQQRYPEKGNLWVDFFVLNLIILIKKQEMLANGRSLFVLHLPANPGDLVGSDLP